MNSKINKTSEKLEWKAPLLIDLNTKDTEYGIVGNNHDGATTASNIS